MRILELVLCAVCVTDLASAMDVVYMDQWCGQTYDISNSPAIRIKLTASVNYRPNMNCTFNVEGDYLSEDRLMIKFHELLTEPVCAADYLAMYDGQNKMYSKIGNKKFCGYETPNEVYTSTGSSLTFYFKSDGSVQNGGFDIILTHYKTGFCSAYEIGCDNGRCIDAGLVCNGYNPCGDNSDCKSTTFPPIWNLIPTPGKTWTIPSWQLPHWTLAYDNFTFAYAYFDTGDIDVNTTWRYTGAVVGAAVGSVIIIIIIVIVLAVRRRRAHMYQRPVQPVNMATVQTTAAQSPTSQGYNQPVPQQFQIPTIHVTVQAMEAPQPPPYEYSQPMPQRSRQIPMAPGTYADQNMMSYPPPPPYSAK